MVPSPFALFAMLELLQVIFLCHEHPRTCGERFWLPLAFKRSRNSLNLAEHPHQGGEDA